MNRKHLVAAALILAAAITATEAADRAVRQDRPAIPEITARVEPRVAEAVEASASESDSDIAVYDFEGAGGPDPQGWTTHDLGKLGPHFHVDDFVADELEFYFSPLQGERSLWCGATMYGDPEHPMSSPGYGNDWKQYFDSVPFAVTGDVTIAFKLRYDMAYEVEYDWFYLQCDAGGENWVTLLERSGTLTQETVVETVPAAEHGGELRFRLLFYSDRTWSDEDGMSDSYGAVIVDSLTVSDDSGIVDHQDFESEPVGATSTLDGKWTAWTPHCGNYAALISGTDALQEDIQVTNDTNLWCFYSGSPDDYACGGHPEQLAVPFPVAIQSTYEHESLHNEIRSPWIQIDRNLAGEPFLAKPDSLRLGFDVYRDLPMESMVFYTYRYRLMSDYDIGDWQSSSYIYHGPSDSVDWYHPEFGIHVFPPYDKAVQIGLQAADMAWYYCPLWGYDWPTCHSHSPLLDNVELRAVNATVVGPAFTESPDSLSVDMGEETAAIVGSLFVAGLTEAAGPGADIAAMIGYGPEGTDPAADQGDWIWVGAAYQDDSGGADRFAGTLTVVDPGDYSFCYSFQVAGGPVLYADLDGSANGYDPEAAGILEVVDPLSDVPDPAAGLAASLRNYPNPFNPRTVIEFNLPRAAAVTLRIFDLNGREVARLLDGAACDRGRNEAVWDGRDRSGRRAAAGTYVYRLEAGGEVRSRRMMLVK